MRTPFILVALPGTGKTTLFEAVCKEMNKNIGKSDRKPITILTVDKEVKRRLKNPYDLVLKKFLEKHKHVDAAVFAKDNFRSADFIKPYSEELWRELEGDFLVDIMENHNLEDIALDIGGKMFLRENVRKVAKEKGIVPVFLYASEEFVEKNLTEGDNWKKRSNYESAGEKGWKNLAAQHRKDRSGDMLDHSSIVMDVSEVNPDNIKDTSPATIAKQLLYRVLEYQLQQERKNKISEVAKPQHPGSLIKLSNQKEKVDTAPIEEFIRNRKVKTDSRLTRRSQKDTVKMKL